MESSLHLLAICFILQNISLFPVLLTTLLGIILLVYLIVRQYIFITTKLKGDLSICDVTGNESWSLHYTFAGIVYLNRTPTTK